MIDVLMFTIRHKNVQTVLKRFLLITVIALLIILLSFLPRADQMEAGSLSLIFQMHLMMLQAVTIFLTHAVWTKSLREPLADGRLAALLLMPLSRTQVGLGIYLTGAVLGLGTWLVSVGVYAAALAIYSGITGLQLIAVGTAWRLIIGQLLALLTLISLQFVLAAEMHFKQSWLMFGVVVPFIFLALGMMSQVFEPLSWLKYLTPVTLTAGTSVLSDWPGTGRTVVQLIISFYLIMRSRKQFARRNIRPALAEST